MCKKKLQNFIRRHKNVASLMIYIIHKISVLLKIARTLKSFLKSIIEFIKRKKTINLFTTYNDEKFKV